MFILGIAICASGFLASLLPHLQKGLVPWSICLLVFVLYPLLLQRTFKENRADYEFRLLHWFPAGVMFFWALLEVFGPRTAFVHILQLGFMFLWGLPLVAMGLLFMILFSVHVLRRSAIRVSFLSIFLLLFSAGAIAAEAEGWNPSLQEALYSPDGAVVQAAEDGYAYVQRLVAKFGSGAPTQSGAIALNPSSSVSSSSARSKVALMPVVIASSSSSSLKPPVVIAEKKPKKLPKSGPESAGFIIVSLLAFYSAVIHRRARQRIDA
jgi:hypothetical protein